MTLKYIFYRVIYFQKETNNIEWKICMIHSRVKQRRSIYLLKTEELSIFIELNTAKYYPASIASRKNTDWCVEKMFGCRDLKMESSFTRVLMKSRREK